MRISKKFWLCDADDARSECFVAWELKLLGVNGGRFEINQLLFADDTVLIPDSEKKLCGLVSVFGRVCERRKLRVNVGKSKVMRCSRYENRGHNHVGPNGEPLQEVDCFNIWGWKWQQM